MDRMTTKAQESVREAVDIASRRGNPELYPEHFLRAILTQDGGVGAPIVQKAGANLEDLLRRHGGNRRQAAEAAGIDPSTLFRKLSRGD